MDHSEFPRSAAGGFTAQQLKAEATALQQAARDRGEALARGHALEQVARRHGFKDWNAAAASCAVAALKIPAPVSPVRPRWEDPDLPLATLPFRIHRADDKRYDGIREVMRWAQQYEAIASMAGVDERRRLLGLIGGNCPYVFVSDRGRYGDDRYRLCDRGYDTFKSLTFTRQHIEEVGAVEWNERYCGHSGTDMVALVGDDVRYARDPVRLKQLARLLADVAVLADATHYTAGMTPESPPTAA